MTIYYTKQSLYEKIAEIRDGLELSTDSYPLNVVQLCHNEEIDVEFLPFTTDGLRGMVQMGNESHGPLIILNQKNLDVENNFYCAHELMHAILHQKTHRTSFSCYDRIKDKRNAVLEWHANEGGAEFIIPYRIFIPRLMDLVDELPDISRLYRARRTLAKEFNTTEIVIRNRIENLKYEIDQYRSGVPIEDVKLLSQNQLDKRGIITSSLNEQEEKAWAEEYRSWRKAREQQ